MSAPFVHLHLHSEYSLVDGIVKFDALAEKCARSGQAAAAITDVCNLYGMVKFYRACVRRGVKPVIGCDVWMDNPVYPDRTDRCVLLCMNEDGFKTLSRVLTRACLAPESGGKTVINWGDLPRDAPGLICIMDDHQGPLANSGEAGEGRDMVSAYQARFGDRLYLAISRTGRPGEQEYIRRALHASRRQGVALVATNRVVFLDPGDFEAHEIRVCINDSRVLDDSRRPRNFTDQQYLKTGEEMHALFADVPAALDNSVEIARRCNLFINFENDYLPDYPDSGGRPVNELLREQAETGLAGRLGESALYAEDGSARVGREYLERLDMELGVIEQMGYSGYFLIVADFIRWSRENGIPVGPGRGSGAGSLVAWATGITEIDPLPYGLLFERFLNPERVSLPDFDIDFCVDGRDRVIEYVASRYGSEQVAQIITFGTMAAKAVVRDVGRVMGLAYGFVDQVAKLIPFEVGMTLRKALQQEEALRERYEQEGEVQELIDSALQLEGIARNVGKHAGGVVIAPRPLTEYTPLYADSHLNQAITQLDKDDLEAIGLVKFDFLGLRTLTIIDSAVKLINQQRAAAGEALLDMSRTPLDDQPTFEFIRAGRTTAVFQLESRGMQELIVRAHPETFEDLVALIAMFRPGPLQSGMVEDFVNRKAGREPIVHLHPDIEHILNTTYGVILYQEQVMQIAQTLAGYTLGGADILRKAMGKKLPEEMARQRETFMAGAVSRGVREPTARMIFDLMDKFAGYGFNKSHSAAYALVSYHTAWLKTHYPAAYMAATLSADLDNTDKVVTLLADCKSLGLEILPPDINSGFHAFRPLGEREISYGLGAVRGVGRGVIESIVAEREQNGAFDGLFDFCRRVDLKKANKRVLEALIKSGAMDSLDPSRAALMSALPGAVKAADQQQSDRERGQHDMFGVSEAESTPPAVTDAPQWSEEERLKLEKETLGLYLSGHPYDRYARELEHVVSQGIDEMDLSVPKNGIFAGTVVAKRVINTRRGKMAFATLDNMLHRVEIGLFSNKFSEYFPKLQNDGVLVALGELSTDEFTGGCQIRAEQVLDVDEVRRIGLRRLEIRLRQDSSNGELMQWLHATLSGSRGGKTRVSILYTTAAGESGRIDAGDDWCVTANQDLIEQLEARLGAQAVDYHYDSAALYELIPRKNTYRHKAAITH